MWYGTNTKFCTVCSSVMDPGPYFFGGRRGSGSVIILYGSESGHQQAKKFNKKLDFFYFVILFRLFFLRSFLHLCPKLLGKIIFPLPDQAVVLTTLNGMKFLCTGTQKNKTVFLPPTWYLRSWSLLSTHCSWSRWTSACCAGTGVGRPRMVAVARDWCPR